MIGWRCLLASLLALALMGLGVPQAAIADSGGAMINTLPGSYELEGQVEVHHECGGVFQSERERSCPWFGEASQYPADVQCPGALSESHYVWSGPVEQGSATSSGSFSFTPEAGEVVLCLYVFYLYSEGTSLVGRSHPFNTGTGSEVLPQSPSKKATRAVVTAKLIDGCKALIYGDARSGGENERDGKWSAVFVSQRKPKVIDATAKQPWFWTVEGPPGRYRLTANFEGNATLLASPPTTIVFSLHRCRRKR